MTNCEQSKAVSSFSLFLQLTAVAPKTGKTLQKREIYAFPAFPFNNTCTPYHQMGKHRENLVFLLFFGHNAIDCKNELFWGVFHTFGNMRIICPVSQQNREMCENGVFGGYFALFLETFPKHVHYVHKLLYMQQTRFCRRF